MSLGAEHDAGIHGATAFLQEGTCLLADNGGPERCVQFLVELLAEHFRYLSVDVFVVVHDVVRRNIINDAEGVLGDRIDFMFQCLVALIGCDDFVGEGAPLLSEGIEVGGADDAHVVVVVSSLIYLVPEGDNLPVILCECRLCVGGICGQLVYQEVVMTAVSGHQEGRKHKVVGYVLQLELILYAVHQAGIQIDGLHLSIGCSNGASEALGGEVFTIVVRKVAVVVEDGTGTGRLGQLAVRCVATAMVIEDEQVLLGRACLGRPVDEVGQRVGAGAVGVRLAVERAIKCLIRFHFGIRRVGLNYEADGFAVK